jgi:hypothetical protein
MFEHPRKAKVLWEIKSCDVRPYVSHLYTKRKGGPPVQIDDEFSDPQVIAKVRREPFDLAQGRLWGTRQYIHVHLQWNGVLKGFMVIYHHPRGSWFPPLKIKGWGSRFRGDTRIRQERAEKGCPRHAKPLHNRVSPITSITYVITSSVTQVDYLLNRR